LPSGITFRERGERIKTSRARESKVVGLVALRPSQPAFSGRPDRQHSQIQPAWTRRPARRDSSQREVFHLLMRALRFPDCFACRAAFHSAPCSSISMGGKPPEPGPNRFT
jgi:hypothetical protein